MGYPDHYCDCHERSLAFYYGMDTIISSDTWYTSTLRDVSAGFSAYWFASSPVIINGYIVCAQSEPTMSQQVGSNSAYHMDIQELLARFGGSTTGMLADKQLYVHASILDSVATSGRLVITPYDRGPHSTCDNPLPFYAHLPYVISDTDNVYVMAPMKMTRREQAIRWVCERGDAVDVSISVGSCNAAPLYSATLTDSLHVWNLPYEALYTANRQDSLFFHFHTTAKLGVAKLLRSVEFLSDTTVVSECLGKTIVANGITYSSDTILSDTAYVGLDTVGRYMHQLQVTRFELSFPVPEVSFDTIRCHADSLGFLYLGQRSYPINSFGDYTVYYRRAGQCDRDIRLHVEEVLYPIIHLVDTTTCYGRRLRFCGQYFTSDTTFRVSTWSGRQETITTYKLRFTMPAWQNDTAYCYAEELPYTYRGKKITSFGRKSLTITDPTYRDCAERVRLMLIQLWHTDTIRIDTTVCADMRMALPGTIEQTDSSVLTMLSDGSTQHYTCYSVHYALPDTVADTLRLHRSRLPYAYYAHTLTAYGDTMLFVRADGECSRYVRLHVEELVDEITTEYRTLDTTICSGMTLRLNGVEYRSSADFVDTCWVADNVVRYTTCHLVVSDIITVYDTLCVFADSLPVQYLDRSFPDFADYSFILHEEGACDRLVRLTLTEHPLHFDTVRVDTTCCNGITIALGDTVLYTNTTFSRSSWNAAHDSCTTTVYTARFVDMAPQNDTIYVLFSQLPYTYLDYPGGKLLSDYADYSLSYREAGQCRQTFHVALRQRWVTDTVVVADTVCAGGMESHSVVQEPRNKQEVDSVLLTFYDTYVADPIAYYDTLVVWQDSLPVSYADQSINREGDYDWQYPDESGCLVRMLLHVEVLRHDALSSVYTDRRARKFVRNGRLYISVSGYIYDAVGQLIEINNLIK